MDISSLTESQQQQLQQLHQQFQQHQQEQKQQQVQSSYNQSSYDPSSIQSYTAQPYYHSYPQYQQQQYQHLYYQQQQPPDCTQNFYTQQPQNDSTPIQPPGISVGPDIATQQVQSQQGYHYPQQQQEQNAYYSAPAAVEQQQQQQEPSSSSYPGLNPAAAAAVAALSQLTQFAGNMDAAERAMADRQHWDGRNNVGGIGYGPAMSMEMPPHMATQGGYLHHGPYPDQWGGRSPYRGGGRRGRGSYRGGGGRGNFSQRPPRTDGSNSQFQGRGRGRGGNRRFPRRAASSQPEVAPVTEPDLESEHGDVAALAVVQGQTSLSVPVPPSAIGPGQAPAPGKVSSSRKQPQIAWCELCRVDCTSLDILEQHKNGKKHKKNFQRFEELQKAGNPSMPVSITVPAPVLVTNPTPTSGSAPAPVAVSMPSLTSTSISEITTAPMPEMQDQPLSESKPEAIAQPENVEGGETTKSEALENISTEVTNGESKLESEQQHDKVGQAKVAEGEPTDASEHKRKFDRIDVRKSGTNRKTRGGRGSKRIRTSDRPTRPVKPLKPKEMVPIICDLCNVKCDTEAVFETHLAGKKHISKLKRFQGHQAMFGPVGLQALYPPNPNTQPIFIPQVQQHTMYPPCGSFHQPVPYVPHHTQQASTASEFQVKQNHECYGAPVTLDTCQNDVGKGSGGQQIHVVGQEGQLVVVNQYEEKAVDNRLVTNSEHVASAKDVALTVVDYGDTTSFDNVILPGLDTKMQDATSKNEE